MYPEPAPGDNWRCVQEWERSWVGRRHLLPLLLPLASVSPWLSQTYTRTPACSVCNDRPCRGTAHGRASPDMISQMVGSWCDWWWSASEECPCWGSATYWSHHWLWWGCWHSALTPAGYNSREATGTSTTTTLHLAHTLLVNMWIWLLTMTLFAYNFALVCNLQVDYYPHDYRGNCQ